MPFPIPSQERELVPEGLHLGVCTQIIDLGTQETRFADKVSYKRQIRIVWELPAVLATWTDEEGNERSGPRLIAKKYTASTDERSNLYRDLKSWKGKSFAQTLDLEPILGDAAMLTVQHEEGSRGEFAKIVAVSPVEVGKQVPGPSGDLVLFHLDYFDREVFMAFPDWLRDQIEKSDEWRAAQRTGGPITDDDVPF